MIELIYKVPLYIYDKRSIELMQNKDIKPSLIREINESLHDNLEYFDDLMYYNADDEFTVLVAHALPLDISIEDDIRPYTEIRVYSGCESLSSNDIEKIRDFLAREIIPSWGSDGFDCGKDNRYHIELDSDATYYLKHLFITDETGYNDFKEWKSRRKRIISNQESKRSLNDLLNDILHSYDEMGRLLADLGKRMKD